MHSERNKPPFHGRRGSNQDIEKVMYSHDIMSPDIVQAFPKLLMQKDSIQNLEEPGNQLNESNYNSRVPLAEMQLTEEMI